MTLLYKPAMLYINSDSRRDGKGNEMNKEQIVEKMKETKSQMRRPNTLALVNEVRGLADAQTVRAAAIAYHTAEYNCQEVPADTMKYIDSALGFEVAESTNEVPFNPNW